MPRPIRWLVLPACFVAGALSIPGPWCGRDGEALYHGDPELQARLARGVAGWIDGDVAGHRFRTGSVRFDGEWLFGTHVMAAMGYGQLALERRGAEREAYVALMRRSLEGALDPRVRAFDTRAWGSDAIEDLGTDRAHAAYLGYLAMPLALHRTLDRASPFADLSDRITAHLTALSSRSPTGLVETYPGEVYPVDNTAFVGSLGPHGAATGRDHRAVVDAFLARLDARYREAGTGLLVQAVDPGTGAVRDGARGSGTLLASYFLSYVDRDASSELWRAARAHLYEGALGFAAMREYPPGHAGSGDIDSGPIFLGLGVSATGFALGASRVHGARDAYCRIWATTRLVGAPVDRGDARRFALGGPIGDSLLFAMLTAPRRLPWDA